MKNRILPVFISFAGCTSRCIYCNQHRITGVKNSDIISSAKQQIKENMSYGTDWTELAFYGGSFSCLPDDIRLSLYGLAEETGIGRLRFSTSPDCINARMLDEAVSKNVQTIELGVQSLDDDVLKANKRPYLADECIDAVRMVRDRVEKCGIQLMAGMHGETAESFMLTAEKAADLKAAYARIYPTVVIADTELAELYKSGAYKPITLAEAVSRCAYAYVLLTASDCEVIRIGLHDSESVRNSALAGAYHPAMGEMVKTVVVATFFEMGYILQVEQRYLNIAYGYGGILKDVHKGSVAVVDTGKPDFKYICRKILERTGEDNKRKLKEQTDSIAERFFG